MRATTHILPRQNTTENINEFALRFIKEQFKKADAALKSSNWQQIFAKLDFKKEYPMFLAFISDSNHFGFLKRTSYRLMECLSHPNVETAHLNCEIHEVGAQFAMVVGLRLTDPSLETEIELGPYASTEHN
jgi:hypothetical protein